MADQKITQLTELATAPDDNDVVAIVDDPAGSPVTKKVKVVNLLPKEAPNEIPSGTINGSNKVFTLAHIPVNNSLDIRLNGSFRTGGGEDYTLVSDTITFVNAPLASSVLRAFYKY